MTIRKVGVVGCGLMGSGIAQMCAQSGYETVVREVNKVCGLHFFNPAPVMKLVEMGATTIWERWDSLRPDGSVNPGEMTSFNHYAFGAVADWLHRTVGGLAPAESGYRHLDIRQHPGGDLTHASARHLTPYGLAEIAWKIETGQIEVVVVVPPNATASVTLPGARATSIEVGSGTHRWSYPYHVKSNHHPRSLDSTISEFIDDPEAWRTVLTTIRKHITGIASHMDIGTIMLHNDDRTLGQTLCTIFIRSPFPFDRIGSVSQLRAA